MLSIVLMMVLLALAIGAFILRGRRRKAAAAREARRTNSDVAPTRPRGGSQDRVTSWVALAVGAVATVLLVVTVYTSFTFHVASKHYGVLTTFGKVSDRDYGPGLHFKAPWQKDIAVDGHVHIDGYTATRDDSYDASYTCINSQLGNGSRSCVDVTVRWQVDKDQASVLYANYGTDDPTDHFGSAVIHAQMQQVIPIVMRAYNPVTSLKAVDPKKANQQAAVFVPDYDALSKQAKDLLQARVTVNGVQEATIQSVAISSAPLDAATNDKISSFNTEVAKTRIAAQAVLTNQNQATANRELESSLEKSPGILVSQCLQDLDTAITKDYQLPAGFNCAVLGGSSALVIPGTNGINH